MARTKIPMKGDNPEECPGRNDATAKRTPLIDHMAAALADHCGVDFASHTDEGRNHWRGLISFAVEALEKASADLKNDEAREVIPRICAFIQKGG